MDLVRQIGGEDRGESTSLRRMVGAVLIGSTIEWYDFLIYGTAAALILNQLFFPSFSPTAGTLLAFATFAAGWFARPLGGLIAGHYGDRVGRKTILVITLLIMGASTFAIGLLPTFEAIGIWAPILLVTIRLLQGLSVGGEWGGAVVLAVEHSPDERRGFYGSWPQMGIPGGLVLGTAVFSLVTLLPEEQFVTWGWRVPFLLSILLVIVGLYLRFRVLETPTFTRMQESRGASRVPALDALRGTSGKRILLLIFALLAPNTFFYTFAVFVLAYATQQLGMANSTILFGVMIAAIIEFFAIPICGAISDRVGRKPMYIGGLAFLGLYTIPFYLLLDTRSPVVIWAALVVGLGIGHAIVYGPLASFFAELFEPRVRYTGISLGYQIAGTLAGAPFPAIATYLVATGGGSPWLLVIYTIAVTVVSLVAASLAPETYRGMIYEELSQERELAVDK